MARETVRQGDCEGAGMSHAVVSRFRFKNT